MTTPKPNLSIRISLIQSDRSSREILSKWIRRVPAFQLASSHADAESAMDALPLIKPAIVLIDIDLPGMNGIACVKLLRPLLPGTQFVMFTTDEDSNHILEALSAGATGYLLKTTPRSELYATLIEIHGGGSRLTGCVARKVVEAFPILPIKWVNCDGLTPRESEVQVLRGKGHSYREIAQLLSVKTSTVGTLIRRASKKLRSEVASRQAPTSEIFGGLSSSHLPEWRPTGDGSTVSTPNPR